MTPTPAQSQACNAAEERCRSSDSLCGDCLDVELKNQSLRTALTVLSGLGRRRACASPTLALLGPVLRQCPLLTANASTSCLDAMLNCSREEGSCRMFITPAPVPAGEEAFPPINYSMVLASPLNELQYACRNDFRLAVDGTGTGTGLAASFPVLPADWSCASNVSACANDPGCWDCFTAYQQVASDVMIGLDALNRCTSATGYQLLNRLLTSCNQTLPQRGHFSEHSANASAAAVARFEYEQLPQACLIHGWACTTESNSNCQGCMQGIGNTSLLHEGSAQPTLGEWHATLSRPDCRRAIQSAGDVDDDQAPGDDDIYDGEYGLAYTATDFALAMAYCSRSVDNVAGGSRLNQGNLVCIFQSMLCDDADSCRVCLGGPPTATSVPVKGGSRCQDPLVVITASCPASYLDYMACPATVAANNGLVVATSVFGAISTVAVVCTLAVIYGHRKDRRSLRERILAGVFAGNLLCNPQHRCHDLDEASAPRSSFLSLPLFYLHFLWELELVMSLSL